VYAAGVDASAVLDGFIITGGQADGPGSESDGGGLYVRSSRPNIVQCQFVDNVAKHRGGAVFCGYFGNATLANCALTGNRARIGGAIAIEKNSSPTLMNCLLADNVARQTGGGLHAGRWCNVTLAHCTVSGNTAREGGGLHARDAV